MNEHTIESAAVPQLLAALLTLLAAHRRAFRQERPYRRAVALVFGELFAFARHTVTQTLLALGLSTTDWTAFYLVNAEAHGAGWTLPLPAPVLLAWSWQRWELEVAHREMKGGFGVGQKQCWNRRAAVVSVQWSVWVYALLLLAGYRTWGWLGGPPRPERWWPGAQRWSFNTLWRGYRAALWGTAEFRALWTPFRDDWLKMETALRALANAALGAARL